MTTPLLLSMYLVAGLIINPCPQGKVGVQWLCHLNKAFVYARNRLCSGHDPVVQGYLLSVFNVIVSICLGVCSP